MDCFKRALIAGLRYRGLSERKIKKLDIPVPATEDEVEQICKTLGLKYQTSGRIESLREPVIVGYYLNVDQQGFRFGGGGVNSHAVFCSDIQPFLEFSIVFIITGFQRKSRWKILSLDNR